MLDKILAAVSMLALSASMGVIAVKVMEPDLWIVTILVLAIAGSFVWQEVREGGSHLESSEKAD